jgi:7-cyano-7-deazaguanine synthase
MCSITGGLFIKKDKDDIDFFVDVLLNSIDRGRDSFGISFLNNKNQKTIKGLGKVSTKIQEIKNNLFNTDYKIIINNNRAEPTTEYISNKTLNDTQPFNSKNYHIVHNGIISNDKELEKKYNIKKNNDIDSSIIPVLLEHKYDGSFDNMCEILKNDLIGSYALAIWDKNKEDELYLATNYKPLYLCKNKITGNYIFTSLEKYLINKTNKLNDFFNEKYFWKEIPPYTVIKINSNEILERTLYIEKENKKTLILASSGLDSTVAASWAIKQGYDISLIHFNYGCKATSNENIAINKLQKFYNCELIKIPIDFYKKIIGNSSIIDNDKDISKKNNGEDGAELALEWVPARNLVFLSIVSAYAEAHDFSYIVLGGNLEESGAYSDNEYIFQKKFNDLLPNALNLQKKVQLLTPLANLMKHEIVKLGIETNAPMHLTWSCYDKDIIPCGECGPDYMRIKAFKMNGYNDMLKYKKNIKDKKMKNLIMENEKWVVNDGK